MKVVTFFTPEYEGEVKAWQHAIAKYTSFQPFAVALETQHTWRLNCGMKPKFLLECLEIWAQPLLWIDVDGRVQGELSICQELIKGCDFGAWFIPWDQMNPGDRPGGAATKNDGIASGTMFWNHTPASLDFLRAWRDKERGQGVYEQVVLGELWHGYDHQETGLRTRRLPQSYCKVFDRPWKRGEAGPIQIEHFQASRRLKKRVR